MSLLRLLRALCEMEQGISIADPIAVSKPKTFLTVPDRDQKLGSLKAVFEHIPEPAGDEGRLGPLWIKRERVRIRFSAHDADFDRGVEIAVAFYDAFNRALDAERPAAKRLSGAFDHFTIQPEQGGTFSSYEGRPGWELLIDFDVLLEDA